MTKRVPCPPAPGPLEACAARFDDLFSTLAQRRGFREYPAGLLPPRDRNKTPTCLAGTEPVVGAQHPAVQRLQFFLSESTWDHERINARRVELLPADSATAPRAGVALAREAKQAGVSFRAVAADRAYGDQDGFRCELADAGLPFVMALKPRHGIWARGDRAHTPVDAARALAWRNPQDPGDWRAVPRAFRDGHTETWWAADPTLGSWGPDGTTRLVVATADPATLPAKAT